MKLAYMYATPDVTHDEVKAIRGDMAEVLSTIKNIGYTGVELLVRDPREINQKKLSKIVEDLQLDVPAICTDEISGGDKISFADKDPHVRHEAIDRMKACLQMAEDFGAMVNVGLLRGAYTKGVPVEQTYQWIKEAIVKSAEAYPHVRIVMEPISGESTNCLLSSHDILQFVEDVGLSNVGIMLELEHMLTEGENIFETIQQVKTYFWHFHISDMNWFPPGYGQYDFNIIKQILVQSGYNGYVTIKSFQKPNSSLAILKSYETIMSSFNKQIL